MMKMDIEHIAALRGFIHPVLFPFKTSWKDQRILYIGGVGEVLHFLERQFPEAAVTQLDVEAVISGENHLQTFDYIAAPGLKSALHDIPRRLAALLSLLKPGGVISAAVYGYAGYYGLEMLSRIIKNLTKDIKDIFDNKNFAGLFRVGKAVITQLPSNHPAFQREASMGKLEKGDKKAFKELLNLSGDKIFTVSRLLECIDRSGGRLVDWVLPELYDPAQVAGNSEIAEKLAALPEPRRWKAAELINARPAEHYFFLAKKDDPPVKIAWDSNDLYLWKPVRLPLYRWKDIKGFDSGSFTGHLRPLTKVEGIGSGSLELQEWEAQLCLSASGAFTLNRLLSEKRLNGKDNLLLKRSHPRVIEFLKRAVEGRLLALLPPSALFNC